MCLIPALALRDVRLQRTFGPVRSNIKSILARALLLVCTSLLAPAARAQIPMSGGTYSQNFDSLASTGTDIAWVNNIT